MKKLFTIKGIIAAVAVMFALSLTSCKKDGNEGKDDEVVKVTGIKFTKSEITIAVNKTTTLEYTITPSNATNQAVTFKSSDEKVATVSTNGEVKGISEGTAKITVTTKDGGFKATCNVTVNKGGSGEGEQKILVETITIEPSTKELNVEETFQLEATVLPVDAADKTLTWTSSSDNVTVDLSGKITAVKEGTATITATAKDGSEAKATCEVTVKKKNYKSAYTKSDYYQWDAYESCDKTNTKKWEPNSSMYHDGRNVTAEQSCKNCCDLETAKKYLSEDVYWDIEGPAYTVDGSEYKTGLWVKKQKFLAKDAKGQEKRTPIKLREIKDTEQVELIREGGEYFFLPAAGYYKVVFGSTQIFGMYWLNSVPTPGTGDRAFYFGIKEESAFVSDQGLRQNGYLRLVAE